MIEQERIIHPAWLWGAGGMVLLALLTRQGVLFLAAALLLCGEGVSYLWGRRALAHVGYARAFSRTRVAWGECVTMRVEVENRKILPLPWLRVEDEMPAALALSAPLAPSHKFERRLLRNLLSVLWYQRVIRRYTLTCAARGEHLFGPAELHAGDIFGLCAVRLAVAQRDALLVYPKIVPLAALGLPATQPFGDLRTTQRLFEDPLRTVGIRDYLPGDSLRYMHWKATAVAGTPQVRVFAPVRTLRALLFLDVVTGQEIWHGADPDLLELAILTTASTAVHLLDAGFEVGLYTNGRALLREGLVGTPPSAAPGTRAAILEGLARIGSMAAAPLDRVIARERPHLPGHASVIVISAAPSPALCAALGRLRADGRAVALVCIGGDAVPLVPAGVVVRHVGDERDWRALPGLDLG